MKYVNARDEDCDYYVNYANANDLVYNYYMNFANASDTTNANVWVQGV